MKELVTTPPYACENSFTHCFRLKIEMSNNNSMQHNRISRNMIIKNNSKDKYNVKKPLEEGAIREEMEPIPLSRTLDIKRTQRHT